jgi:hypothetical protein
MGNLETKAALGYDIVQRQANGNKKNKTLKIKDVFMHSTYGIKIFSNPCNI